MAWERPTIITAEKDTKRRASILSRSILRSRSSDGVSERGEGCGDDDRVRTGENTIVFRHFQGFLQSFKYFEPSLGRAEVLRRLSFPANISDLAKNAFLPEEMLTEKSKR